MNPPFSFPLTPNATSAWVWGGITFLPSVSKAVTLERGVCTPLQPVPCLVHLYWCLCCWYWVALLSDELMYLNLSRGKQGIRISCRAVVPCISSWLEVPWLAAPSHACEEGDWDWKVFKVSTIYSEQEEEVWPFSNGKLCQCSHWDFPPGDCLNVTCGKAGYWKHCELPFLLGEAAQGDSN